MKTNLFLGMIAVFAYFASPVGAQTKPLYENNFEKAEAGKAPEDFLILDGQFLVKEEGGNKFLELPGAPLDTFGALFGTSETNDISVSVKILSTAKGRRFPAFSVGLNGAGGYKLQVSPSKKALELFKGEAVLQSIPYEWKSGEWTELLLQVRKTGESVFKVEGKVWSKGAAEPKEWLVSSTETNAPAKGRASIWGSPYSGTPICFDDLVVKPVSER